MKKILVVNVPGLHNLGGMAIVFGAIKSLENSLHDAKITFVSSHYHAESAFYMNNFKNIELIPHLWYRECNSLISGYFFSTLNFISLFIRCILFRYFKQFKSPYSDYDIIIDLNSDALNEHYSLIQPTFSLLNIWLPMLCKKPVVIAASSIGTFDNRVLKVFAKKILNSTKIILAREKKTKNYLINLGIPKEKIHLVGDHAFLMFPAELNRLNTLFEDEGIFNLKKPFVGISPSELIHKYAFKDITVSSEKYAAYKRLMVSIIDHMIETLDVSIILIPHSYQATENDQVISRKIYEELAHKEDTILLKNIYNCNELKGLIGQCEMFIGCRMHSTIASTSMCVPTIALVYGHKSHGILGDCLGLENTLLAMEDYNTYEELLNELTAKINYVWNEKAAIKRHLKEKIPLVEKAALKNGQFIECELELISS